MELNIEVRRLMTGTRFEKCVVKRFRPCANVYIHKPRYRGADKSLARPTSLFIVFDDENISFDASLVIYINSTNIPPIMIINRIYETLNLLSL